MEWDNKTIEVPRRTKVSKALENVDIGVKFDDAEITSWSMVGYPDLDTIFTTTTFLANYNTNIVEKYVYSSYLPGVGVKCLYKEISFVKKGQKMESNTDFDFVFISMSFYTTIRFSCSLCPFLLSCALYTHWLYS